MADQRIRVLGRWYTGSMVPRSHLVLQEIEESLLHIRSHLTFVFVQSWTVTYPDNNVNVGTDTCLKLNSPPGVHDIELFGRNPFHEALKLVHEVRALKLSDGRFVQHPKFRYVVYSMLSTRSCWQGKRNELAALVRGLGCPALFMTFSAADLHWESLAKLMPDYEAWAAGTNEQKIRIAAINLKNNPHIPTTSWTGFSAS
ncbi:hypothetical protein E4U51_004432 [Claviceps purpurea]|nr:hypothetical protein E4U51_004432 [Claviceps purpurea]